MPKAKAVKDEEKKRGEVVPRRLGAEILKEIEKEKGRVDQGPGLDHPVVVGKAQADLDTLQVAQEHRAEEEITRPRAGRKQDNLHQRAELL